MPNVLVMNPAKAQACGIRNVADLGRHAACVAAPEAAADQQRARRDAQPVGAMASRAGVYSDRDTTDLTRERGCRAPRGPLESLDAYLACIGVAGTGHARRVEQGVELRDLFGGQRVTRRGGNVLLQIGNAARARYRHDVRVLGEQPAQRKLGVRARRQ